MSDALSVDEGRRVGVGVVGLGRLGRGVVEACEQRGYPVVLTASRLGGWHVDEVPQVIVDASAPDAHEDVQGYCLTHGVALIECVSNLTAAQWSALEKLARQVPVVRATNLTVGNYLQGLLLERLAALRVPALPPETSVRERHPVTKAHRPSATAAELARRWAACTGTEVAWISSRREGPPVSDHEVTWTWPSETLLLRHSVRRIDAAAAGAVEAIRWTEGRGPGLVDMATVYGDLTARPDSRGMTDNR